MKKSITSITLLVACLTFLTSNLYPCASACNTSSSCQSSCPTAHTAYIPRSQANNRAREMAGWFMNWQMNKVEPKLNHLYGNASIALEYSHSFRPNNITDFLFGPASKNGSVYFSGSKVTNRGTTEILADYFGLPQDYVGRVTFDPVIQNIILDMNAFFALDKWCSGLYLDVHMPLVNTRWALNPSTCTEVIGTASYEYGYMTKLSVERSQLATDPLQFWSGNFIWGDVKCPLKNAKVSCDTLTETKLADIHAYLGYDWCHSGVGHFGAYARASFPTGNRLNGEYLFQPIAGNGGHFELGGGVNSQALLWENNRNHQFWTYLDVYLSHLFGATQKRAYDFIGNGANSRYMLLATYQNQPTDSSGIIDQNHIGNIGLTKEYAGTLLPAANATTLCSQSSTQLQAEFTLKFQYMMNSFTFDFGYNFWGRTAEKVAITGELDSGLYAIKGDAYLYGVRIPGVTLASSISAGNTALAQAGYPTNAIALAPSQSGAASAFTGGNYNPNRTLADPRMNFGVDSPSNASAKAANGPDIILNVVVSPIPGTPLIPIKTSGAVSLITPVNLDSPTSDFNPASTAQPSQTSQKLFVHAAYTGKEKEVFFGSTLPYIGLGGEVEFGSKAPEINGSRCQCSGALSQWGIWLKGGFTY